MYVYVYVDIYIYIIRFCLYYGFLQVPFYLDWWSSTPLSAPVCIYIYIYIYMCNIDIDVYVYICMNIYMYVIDFCPTVSLCRCHYTSNGGPPRHSRRRCACCELLLRISPAQVRNRLRMWVKE